MQFSILITALVTLIMTVSSAPIEARDSMSGDATYYAVGLGSCGSTNSDSEMVAALSGSIMKSKENCGKSVTIKGPSGSVTVKVVDTCPGCAKSDVDMSPAAFKKIASLNAGRVPISWSI
ncbi:RlpA-like double-psi beta-barrel-protein domain-containing protein-containing protein [Thamnidium elegans]|uniref:RlpA-like protein double-psi beta-barrel domain-containing protein n=1 Tax=Thamnidium elegans TaxID=101142 RepID=A0A8H7VWQ9_9FUNG|nr:hypothetical protein INT48_001951 [Thamnidium elegans]KAI8067300.1 RlpA-like double-psi beta-barrel-protein domain-containing protein-containing protein [Thamnidium elegans]